METAVDPLDRVIDVQALRPSGVRGQMSPGLRTGKTRCLLAKCVERKWLVAYVAAISLLSVVAQFTCDGLHTWVWH